ncbi:MAG: glycoside hydrolase family 127 protein, partial [Lachnospiraceae bacterium]|nr:glycoside hydrolase family 127 protein [Lachnospiraceae bacterium]
GMTTYFQAMATGYFKTYGNPTDKFWCCTGTGMENFSKLGESFFIKTEDSVIINQYFSSVLYGEGFTLTVESTIPEGNTVTISVTGECEKNILLRKPDWLAGDIKIESSCIITDSDDYITIEGPVFDSTVIVAQLPMKVTAYNLPDGQNTYGFKYGPVVLSAKLGSDNMETTMTGVAVTIPKEKMIPVSMISTGTEIINICADPDDPEAKPESVETFMQNIDKHMERNNTKELSFTLKGTDANLTYVTHYKQHKERYGLYFEFCN